MRYYQSRFFTPEEFLPPAILKAKGPIVGMWAMDPRIVWTADQIRMHYGRPCTINTWHMGGNLSQRGYRTDLARDSLSQHRFGRAVDMTISGVSADQFRQDVRAGQLKSILDYVTAIEDNVGWMHIDCRPREEEGILFFKKP